MHETAGQTVAFRSDHSAAPAAGGPFIAVIRIGDELRQWLADRDPGLLWLQVEGLLGDEETWAAAAEGGDGIPLDVVVTDPAAEFSQLYHLVAARAARGVRVTMPVAAGLARAVRVAAALGLPVRVLPEQPSGEPLAELLEVADFYLHDPMVVAPIEPFHSLLAALRGGRPETLWTMLEKDPEQFDCYVTEGLPVPPRPVKRHLASLIRDGAECKECRWQEFCAGYFKWPDAAYACTGVKQLFARMQGAAAEIEEDLAELESVSVRPTASNETPL